MANYIRVKNSSNQSGFKLYFTGENIQRRKGVQTVDTPLVTSTSDNRLLIPTTGMVDDFVFEIRLYERDEEVAYSVSATGDETPTGYKTIQAQWDFLHEDILRSDFFIEYEVYFEWLGRTFKGWLNLDTNILSETMSGEVSIKATFKVGKNPFNFQK
jgi:hypothetical protein